LDDNVPPPPPHPLPPGLGLLCPDFVKRDAEEATYEVGVPDLVQAMFHAMTVAYA